MKKAITILSLVSALLIGQLCTGVAFAAQDSPTMGSLEQDLTAYLEVNHPELEPGSAEYVSYLVYDDGTLFMWMESSSWVNIADFYTYCVSKGAKIIKCNSLKSLQNTAKVGDIVQLKKRWQLVSLYYYQ